jgi:hypothetical protein
MAEMYFVKSFQFPFLSLHVTTSVRYIRDIDR